MMFRRPPSARARSISSTAPPGKTHASGTKLLRAGRRIISTSYGSASRSTIAEAAGIGVITLSLAKTRDQLNRRAVRATEHHSCGVADDPSSARGINCGSALVLPSDPLLAVGRPLLFPDRHGLLDAVDHGAAGLERLRAVRRDAGDGDRGLADDEVAEAVETVDGDVGPLSLDGLDDRANFFFSHRAIGVVEDRLDGLPFAVVAHDALEHDERAVGAAEEAPHQRGGVDRVVGEERGHAEHREASTKAPRRTCHELRTWGSVSRRLG